MIFQIMGAVLAALVVKFLKGGAAVAPLQPATEQMKCNEPSNTDGHASKDSWKRKTRSKDMRSTHSHSCASAKENIGNTTLTPPASLEMLSPTDHLFEGLKEI